MAVYLDDFFIRLMTEIWIFCKIDIFSETILVEHTLRFRVLNII